MDSSETSPQQLLGNAMNKLETLVSHQPQEFEVVMAEINSIINKYDQKIASHAQPPLPLYPPGYSGDYILKKIREKCGPDEKIPDLRFRADELAKKFKIPFPASVRRNRQALLFWFELHWAQFKNSFEKIPTVPIHYPSSINPFITTPIIFANPNISSSYLSTGLPKAVPTPYMNPPISEIRDKPNPIYIPGPSPFPVMSVSPLNPSELPGFYPPKMGSFPQSFPKLIPDNYQFPPIANTNQVTNNSFFSPIIYQNTEASYQMDIQPGLIPKTTPSFPTSDQQK